MHPLFAFFSLAFADTSKYCVMQVYFGYLSPFRWTSLDI